MDACPTSASTAVPNRARRKARARQRVPTRGPPSNIELLRRVRALVAAAHVHVVNDIGAGVEHSDVDGVVTAGLPESVIVSESKSGTDYKRSLPKSA